MTKYKLFNNALMMKKKLINKKSNNIQLIIFKNVKYFDIFSFYL